MCCRQGISKIEARERGREGGAEVIESMSFIFVLSRVSGLQKRLLAHNYIVMSFPVHYIRCTRSIVRVEGNV